MSTEPEKRSDEETWARLADSATPGPWTAGGNGIHRKHECVALTHQDPLEQRRADADFIAAARTAVPVLLARLASVAEVREVMRDSPLPAVRAYARDLDAALAADFGSGVQS